jgi:tetratricopeptide (TPR) repeat protein
LRSILARCLAPDPADRYTRGVDLARDLDLWRLDRPLAFADEPRSAELARTARRRRFPLIAGALTIGLAVAVAAVASMAMAGKDTEQAQAKYAALRDRADSGAFGFRRFGHWKLDDQADPATASPRLLGLYNALDDPNWRDRVDVRALPDRQRGELEAWLFEQTLRHAVALADRPDSRADWTRALALLDRTLARVDSAPIRAERSAIRAQLGLPVPEPVAKPAEVPRLPGWIDDYLAGVLDEPLHAREALGHYADALRARPDFFWAHYRSAEVACRIDEYPTAVDHLRACVERSPNNPALRVKLASGLCFLERSTFRTLRDDPLTEALAHSDRALELDPDYQPAIDVRHRVHKAAGRSEKARTDIDRFPRRPESRPEVR